MTQQYLAGELSVLLARLQASDRGWPAEREIAPLRHDAETTPPAGLSSIASRAIDLSDALCFDAVTHGDAHAFHFRAEVAAELREFGVCSGLLPN